MAPAAAWRVGDLGTVGSSAKAAVTCLLLLLAPDAAANEGAAAAARRVVALTNRKHEIITKTLHLSGCGCLAEPPSDIPAQPDDGLPFRADCTLRVPPECDEPRASH